MANKALVIDDDKVTLELLTFQLESEGFEVTTAESGEVGLDQIKQNDFDVILTDLHLPDVSGIGCRFRERQLSVRDVTNRVGKQFMIIGANGAPMGVWSGFGKAVLDAFGVHWT